MGVVAPILGDALADIARDVDRLFDTLLPVPDDQRAPLFHAMRHASIGGGKRLRPLLVVASCALFNVDRAAALRPAQAAMFVCTFNILRKPEFARRRSSFSRPAARAAKADCIFLT